MGKRLTKKRIKRWYKIVAQIDRDIIYLQREIKMYQLVSKGGRYSALTEVLRSVLSRDMMKTMYNLRILAEREGAELDD